MSTQLFNYSRLKIFDIAYNALITENNKGVRVSDIAKFTKRNIKTIRKWFKSGAIADTLNSNYFIEHDIVCSRQYQLTLANISELHHNSLSIEERIGLVRNAFNLLKEQHNADISGIHLSVMASHLKVSPRTIRRWFDTDTVKHEFILSGGSIYTKASFLRKLKIDSE